MGDHTVPLGLLEVDSGVCGGGHDTCDVAENVDASVLVVDAANLRLPLPKVGDVQRCSFGGTARCGDCRNGVIAVLQVETHDVSPLRTQALGDTPTNALVCAGDDCDHSVESLCCHFLFPLP